MTQQRKKNLDNPHPPKMTNQQLIEFLASTRKVKNAVDEALKEVLLSPEETTKEENEDE